MNPRFGKRSWVKLWVNEWLDGTTRYQMSGAQRAFWVDLLALAGRSRYEGIICAGKDGDIFVGYPLKTFGALDAGAEIDIQATFDLFVHSGKIFVEVTSREPIVLYKITICNWDRYQSEYRRQKRYRNKPLQPGLQQSDSKSDAQGYIAEAEADTDTEAEEKQKTKRTAAALRDGAAWKAIGADLPIGNRKFQALWEFFFGARNGALLSDAMERCIQRWQDQDRKVPPPFIEAKRRVEAEEGVSIQKGGNRGEERHAANRTAAGLN